MSAALPMGWPMACWICSIWSVWSLISSKTCDSEMINQSVSLLKPHP